MNEACRRPTKSRLNGLVYHTARSAPIDYFREMCQKHIPGLLPKGLRLRFHRWNGGELHNRYVLTERGGVMFGTGLDEGDSPPEDVVSLLDDETYRDCWDCFGPPTDGTGGADDVIVVGEKVV